ncbi:hypothetical protein PHMEG_00034430 [Phytophthora megakarya]|uniref:Uncharacterized protein n=1 Tax=Phytophthora megakarya TaxID=4795 RepID=A0A225URF2_9STRA|nr:hypothetical protein PHMEG_00034430 [Phytophthora megakarya]
MEWVQQVDSPEFILRTLNRTVILNWTRQFRIDCLLIGMTELQEEIERRSAIGSEVEVAAASALASWIKFIEEQRGTMTDDSYIHSPELWGTIKKLKANEVQS